jgi:hypothetical protein
MESDPRWFITARRPLAHFGDAANRASQQARALAWLAGDADRRLLAAGAQDACFDPAQAVLLGTIRGHAWYLLADADTPAGCRADSPSAAPGPVRWDPAQARTASAVP